MDISLPYLRRFVRESNAIEGIFARDGIWTRNHFLAAMRVAQESSVEPYHPDDIHKLLVRGTHLQPFAGKWRKLDIYVGKTRRTNRCPRPDHVPKLMAWWEGLVREYCTVTHWKDTDTADAAVLLHDLLLCIHPYLDGNGRTARLVLNSLRTYKGLPWRTVRIRDSGLYYARIRGIEEQIVKKEFPHVY